MRFILFPLLLFPSVIFAKAAGENRLATGMGVAAPAVTSMVNVTNGYAPENPAGVMYQDGLRGSLQVARSASINDIGFEAGYSGDTFGLAVGHITPGCIGCVSADAFVGGLSLMSKSLFVGVRYHNIGTTPVYGGGVVINATGTHRAGLTFGYANPVVKDTETIKYGAGYGYVEKDMTVTVELEGQNIKTDPATSKLMLVSLGFQKRVESLQVSINYQRVLNSLVDPAPESFWIGGGFNGESWHVGAYSNMYKQFMIVVSGFL